VHVASRATHKQFERLQVPQMTETDGGRSGCRWLTRASDIEAAN
jgi:hypothetical protein